MSASKASTPSKRRILVVMGAPMVGKSALCARWAEGHFVEFYHPTVDTTWSRTLKFAGESYEVVVRDTPGQFEDSTFLDHRYCVGIDGYLLLFSVANRHSFETVKLIHENLLTFMGTHETVARVLVGTKSDHVGDGRQVSRQEAEALAMEWGCPYLECSAKLNENVERPFYLLLAEAERDVVMPTEWGTSTPDGELLQPPTPWPMLLFHCHTATGPPSAPKAPCVCRCFLPSPVLRCFSRCIARCYRPCMRMEDTQTPPAPVRQTSEGSPQLAAVGDSPLASRGFRNSGSVPTFGYGPINDRYLGMGDLEYQQGLRPPMPSPSSPSRRDPRANPRLQEAPSTPLWRRAMPPRARSPTAMLNAEDPPCYCCCSLRQTWRRRPLSQAFNLREATREKRMAAARRPHHSMSERGSLTESELPSEQPSDAESVYGRDREWELGMDLDSVTHSPGKEVEFRVGSEATGAGREPLDDDDVYRRRLASESQPKDGRASGQSQETSATTPKPFPSHPSSSTIRSVIDLPEAEQEVWECLCHGRLKLNPDVVRLQAIRFLFIFYVIIMIASIVSSVATILAGVAGANWKANGVNSRRTLQGSRLLEHHNDDTADSRLVTGWLILILGSLQSVIAILGLFAGWRLRKTLMDAVIGGAGFLTACFVTLLVCIPAEVLPYSGNLWGLTNRESLTFVSICLSFSTLFSILVCVVVFVVRPFVKLNIGNGHEEPLLSRHELRDRH